MLSRTSVRFGMVGATCALLHNLIMIGGDRLGLHYLASSLVSYGLVTVTGFALHVAFTYRQRPGLAAFGRYAAAMAANYPLSVALIFVQCDLLGWPVALAAPVATAVLVIWNFLATRWAVLRSTRAVAASPADPDA